MRLVAPLVLVASLAGLVGCGGASLGKGPNYSKDPCVDNCGNDVKCQSTCTDVNGPGGVPPLQ